MDHMLNKLNNDFIKKVLPHLIKAPTDKWLSNMSGYGEGKYSFLLGIDTLLEYAPDYKPESNSFVHFTSLKALHSILNEGVIRMYNLQNVNDPNEFSFTASNFGFDAEKLNEFKKKTFVFSMCSSSLLDSEDILTLWRLYGNDGNDCLIEFEIIPDIIPGGSPKINLANVVYKDLNYKEFFEENKRFETQHGCRTNLEELVQKIAFFQKKPLYKVEKEVRVVYNGSVSPAYATYKNLNLPKYFTQYGYDFSSQGDIVLYFKLDLFRKNPGFPKIRIKKIQLGFKNNESKLKEYKKHIAELYKGINNKGEESLEIPTIEFSPLKGEYR